MLQRPFYRKISPSVTDVGAVCDRPRATAGRPYGFYCEFFAILQQAQGGSRPSPTVGRYVYDIFPGGSHV